MFGWPAYRMYTAPKNYEIPGFTMGTNYTVKIVKAENDDKAVLSLKSEVDSLLVEVNQQMSTYISDSEISSFNSSSSTEAFEVSQDFAEVVAFSREISSMTGGAFDPTLSPLINLWGFGPKKMSQKLVSVFCLRRNR